MLAVLGGIWGAFKTPIGRDIGVVFLALAFTAGVYAAGYHARAAVSKEATYKAERDAALRDLLISQQAAKVAEEMASSAETDAAEARKKADDYAKRLPKGTGADLTDFDVRELQRIRERKRR